MVIKSALLKRGYWAISLLTLLVANQVVGNIFAAPWRDINYVVGFFIITLALSSDAKIILASFIAGGYLDIFTHYPFGTNAVALTIAVALVRWLWLAVLTDRSVQIVFINGLIGLVVYRLVIILIIFFSAFLNSSNHGVGLSDWTRLLHEVVFSLPVIILVYLVMSRFVRKLNPKYVSLNNDLFYGRRKTIV